ncbi:oxidoreductase [Saccharopolyspora oryzae]|uniref:Oxidoreductase n=1 Tax=Saccharopolyspora oryzae TaxID=2997343 RepID=A0ABT4V098_9PSEU|nr:oxidoreductase [Saccharopolyspora oryzae]MDA3626866.1 oxidoreductase [Saccharopolyspora oryzae]
MGLFDRFRRRRAGKVRGANSADAEHLIRWTEQHRGVEGYLEPRTTVTETTLMLIAHDGEWTRRRVDGPAAAHRLTRKLGIPLYEVAKIGYPQRMRDYQARQRIIRDRNRRAADGG